MSSVEVYSKYFGEFGVDIAQYIKTTQKKNISNFQKAPKHICQMFVEYSTNMCVSKKKLSTIFKAYIS